MDTPARIARSSTCVIGLPASFLQREQNRHNELGIFWQARYRDNATTRFLIGLAWGWKFGHLCPTRGKYTCVQAAADEHFNDDDADDVSLPGLDEDDSNDEVPVDTDSSDRAAAPRLPSQSYDHLSQEAGATRGLSRGHLRCSKWTTWIEKRTPVQLPIKGTAHRRALAKSW